MAVVAGGGDDGAGGAVEDGVGVLESADGGDVSGEFDEAACGFDFGSHGAGGWVEGSEGGGCGAGDVLLVGCAVVGVDRRRRR